jgi:hypothetical protein
MPTYYSRQSLFLLLNPGTIVPPAEIQADIFPPARIYAVPISLSVCRSGIIPLAEIKAVLIPLIEI